MSEPAPVSTLTKSQVNRAGQAIRRLARDYRAGEIDRDELLRRATPHVGTILEYRAAHQYALAKATMGLRSMVKTEGCPVEVSQRLKRISTILDKIRRHPAMALSTRQDIGGCRAVLRTVDELRRVEQRLRKNRTPVGVDDYVATPRDSGYRGVHVIVTYPDKSGVARLIEVQLRTRTMHEWAIAVERWGGRISQDLKSGDGPREVLDLFRAISQAMAVEEQGGVVGEEYLEYLRGLRNRALPFMEAPS